MGDRLMSVALAVPMSRLATRLSWTIADFMTPHMLSLKHVSAPSVLSSVGS